MTRAFAHESRMMLDEEGRDRPRGTTHVVAGNRLTLLATGEERRVALLDLIDGARECLSLYFYIFANDASASEVVEALVRARERGVRVTLMIDAFGSGFTSDAFFRPLVDAGGRFGRFGHRRSTRYLIRNHQKMVIADKARAMTGGFNVADPYFAGDEVHDGWRDIALRVEGQLAEQLESWFDRLSEWTLESEQRFRTLRRMVRTWQPGEGPAVWLMGGPARRLNGWARRIKKDLQAGNRLDMAEAYFSPGWSMVSRINKIARRGAVRLVVPTRSDNYATIGAARHLYKRLLRAGVSVFEFLPQKLHIKLMVVDDISYVGSPNFDMRSLFLNVELVLRVEDAGFAQAVRAEIDALAVQSHAIDATSYEAMSGPLSRLRWWIDYLLVGVLDYTVTRRLNFRRRPRD